jgi:lipopolysaccharide assembly outer membrane protein LptD (OstA)
LFDSNSGVAVIEGNAVVDNSTATLKADKISINTKTKFGHAEGNVKLEQSSATLNGTEADYFWETSTGTIKGASGVNPPFRFTADRMTQLSPDLFKIEGGEFTTCDEVPPHYHIKAKSGIMRRGKRVTLKNAELVPDDTPSFWSPIYSKSLVPKKYRLQIEPGHTSRRRFCFTFG